MKRHELTPRPLRGFPVVASSVFHLRRGACALLARCRASRVPVMWREKGNNVTVCACVLVASGSGPNAAWALRQLDTDAASGSLHRCTLSAGRYSSAQDTRAAITCKLGGRERAQSQRCASQSKCFAGRSYAACIASGRIGAAEQSPRCFASILTA